VLDTIGAGAVGAGAGALTGGVIAQSRIKNTPNGYLYNALRDGLHMKGPNGEKPSAIKLNTTGAPAGIVLPKKLEAPIPVDVIERRLAQYAKLIRRSAGRGGLIGGALGLGGMGLSHLLGGSGAQKQAGFSPAFLKARALRAAAIKHRTNASAARGVASDSASHAETAGTVHNVVGGNGEAAHVKDTMSHRAKTHMSYANSEKARAHEAIRGAREQKEKAKKQTAYLAGGVAGTAAVGAAGLAIANKKQKQAGEGSIPDIGAPHNNHNSVSDAILKNQADPSPALSHPYEDNTLHALPPPGYKPEPATPQVPVGPGGEYDIKNTMAAPLGVNKLAMYIEALNKLAKANVVMHKEDKNPSGGLTQHGRDKYNRETGSHLKAPVTQKNPKGEAKGRKASFCARMSGVKGPMKDEHGKPTRKALALRKWNCS
jgi:hypothetical protein